MSISRVTAIVPIGTLDQLERDLRECGVPGVTVERVRGYGRYRNYFRRDQLTDDARVVLFVERERIDSILETVSSCMQKCGANSGIAVVESIDRFVQLTCDSSRDGPAR
jgi:nitrogen regulatory protein P-II 1